jgi:hypothetical protein
MSGKGSKPRPYSVDQETFINNWDRIFGNKKREKALDEMMRISDEIGAYVDEPIDNPLIKKIPE